MLNEQTFVPGAYSAYGWRAIPPRPEGAGLPSPDQMKRETERLQVIIQAIAQVICYQVGKRL